LGASIAGMPSFHAADGTELAYHVRGEGAPLVCLPGGPGLASAYLGDLGGLSAHRQLIMLDVRGTGESATPADPASYRCDHLVDDVAALQDHLGLDRIDLLGHSAGANVAVQYAVRHARRVSRLVLITPSARAVGLEVDGDLRREMMSLRRDEPWFAKAAAAFERGAETDDDWMAIAPFFYGRWDAAAQAHCAAAETQTSEEAALGFAADGAFDPAATRAAAAAFGSPVLALAGGVDPQWPPLVVKELAALFPAAQFVVQPGAGHYPWLDDPEWFVAAVTAFLDGKS
jgi:proline iminopeptidase